MGKRDDQDADREGDEWVIATWCVRHSAELLCVSQYEGKIRPDIGGKSWSYEWYTWKSYQAARKFRDAHPELEGFIILNLSKIRRQAELTRRLFHERIAEEAKRQASEG